jgi:hypothetical protein
MSNQPYSDNKARGGLRSAKTRGGYGRPKTRCPFPNTPQAGESTRVTALRRAFGHAFAVDGKTPLMPNMNLNICINGSKKVSVARGKKGGNKSWTRPEHPDLATTPQQKLQLKAQHQRFASISRDSDVTTEASGSQCVPLLNPGRVDSIDLDSSFKLTFYNPQVLPQIQTPLQVPLEGPIQVQLHMQPQLRGQAEGRAIRTQNEAKRSHDAMLSRYWVML